MLGGFIMKKRITSLVLTLLMIQGISTTSFATEISFHSANEEVAAMATMPNATVMPLNVTTLKECTGFVTQDGAVEFQVTPAKGTNLKLVGGCTSSYQGAPMSSIKVAVTKKGGWWPSKTLNIAAGESGTYNLITNCNGEPYTIKVTTEGVSSYVVFNIVSTEYS